MMTIENIIRHSFTAILERVNFSDYVKVNAYHLSWKFRVFIGNLITNTTDWDLKYLIYFTCMEVISLFLQQSQTATQTKFVASKMTNTTIAKDKIHKYRVSIEMTNSTLHLVYVWAIIMKLYFEIIALLSTLIHCI